MHVGKGRRACDEVERLVQAHHTLQITERLLHAGQGVHRGPLRRLGPLLDGHRLTEGSPGAGETPFADGHMARGMQHEPVMWKGFMVP